MIRKKSLVLINNASPEYIRHIAELPAHEIIPASIDQFISGEGFVELYFGQKTDFNQNQAKLENTHAVVIHSTNESKTKSVDEECMELFRSITTLKDYGVEKVTAVLPFAAFDRQDRDFPGRFTSKAARQFAKQLKDAGADRVVRITPHSKAAIGFYEKVFGKENVVVVSTAGLFAEKIRRECAEKGIGLDQISIGAPDGADKPEDEGQRRAFELARELFGDLSETELRKHMFFITKEHVSVNETKIISEKSVAEVKGKHCFILDDMIDGGSTMKRAAVFLKTKKAANVIACATHGLLSNDALEKILSEKPASILGAPSTSPAIDKLIITDTVPTVYSKIEALRAKIGDEKSTTRNAMLPTLNGRVEVLSTAPLIAQAIQQLPSFGRQRDSR